MIDISAAGRILLAGAMAASAWTIAASLLGASRKDRRWTQSGSRALHATTVLFSAAVVLLLTALISRDFSIAYVANYTSRSTPFLYTVSSLWAGMEGSLLFWTLLTGLYASTASFVQRERKAALVPVANTAFGTVLLFFSGMLVFAANPFDPLAPIPFDGAGLNPLLQSPFMAIHPVLLYLGMTGFTVPFAFAVASLVKGRLDSGWFTSTRRWTILAWSFLTVGIILGGAWAYSELGWGGYWAWDPVENASLLPWLTGTAFLHSVLIQERRGMLKVWNVALILTTYSLAIFGTFLTRSGLLSSVHTFSESPVGPLFLPFLAILMVGAFALLGWRYDKLRSDRNLESLLSREAMFLFNNLLFVTIAFVVLWGTLYPILVEATSGAKISVGPPFFNSVIVPVGLALLAMTGIGPLVAWRKASSKSLKRDLAFPLAAGAATILGVAIAGLRSTGAIFALGLSTFVAAATAGEFVRGALSRRKGGTGFLGGLIEVIARNRRRYGGYIVHLGVVLIFVGFSGSAMTLSWKGTVEPGDSFEIGRYSILYRDHQRLRTEERMIVGTTMEVTSDGKRVATLRPQRNFHIAQSQPQSEVGIHTTLTEDLYLVLTQMDDSGTAAIQAWVNPLVAWIWIGGIVMTAGMVVILSAKPAGLTRPASAMSSPRGKQEAVV
ncbi:MAG: heme lyase CcmF/NrfE family subunit [Actinobacteria bacterium]|nr:heme lyase CcmF/NrfE family subunit [Actinomycetota bacterium]